MSGDALYTQVRAEIAAEIAAAVATWTAYPLVVELDNRKAVDQASQTDPYLKVSIKFLSGGGQMDLGAAPRTEQRGQIMLAACCRAGEGTADALALLQHFSQALALRDLATARLNAFELAGSREVLGWWHEFAIVNFWYTWD